MEQFQLKELPAPLDVRDIFDIEMHVNVGGANITKPNPLLMVPEATFVNGVLAASNLNCKNPVSTAIPFFVGVFILEVSQDIKLSATKFDDLDLSQIAELTV